MKIVFCYIDKEGSVAEKTIYLDYIPRVGEKVDVNDDDEYHEVISITHHPFGRKKDRYVWIELEHPTRK